MSVLERSVVLCIGGTVLWVGWRLLFRPEEVATFLGIINQDWKVLLILLIPLFYQTIRKFLEEVEEAYGMKRHRLKGQVGQQETRP